MVCNPCTGETRFIVPCNHYEEYSMFAKGYEDNKFFCNYKLLRCRNNDGFEIYEFTSRKWRDVPEVTRNFLIQSPVVSLKGNSYWLVFGSHLLIFDFSTERFESLCLPFKNTCSAALSTVEEEKLSVLNQTGSLEIEVWVATSDKIDETIVLLWERFLTVDIFKYSAFLLFSAHLSFYIDEEKKLVVCFCDGRSKYAPMTKIQDMVLVIGEYGVYREIRFGEIVRKSRHIDFFNYAPNLVQVEENIVMPRSGKSKARNLSIKAKT